MTVEPNIAINNCYCLHLVRKPKKVLNLRFTYTYLGKTSQELYAFEVKALFIALESVIYLLGAKH